MEVCDFVDFSLAVKLKEKGFYYECVATYDNDGILGYNYIQPTNIRAIGFDDCLCSHNVENDNCIDAPTIAQVLKWLREEKKIAVNIEFIPYVWQYKVFDMSFSERFKPCGRTFYKNYEEAAIAGVNYCLENLI